MNMLFPESNLIVYPFPAAVQQDPEEDWTVVSGLPMADFGRNLLSVPLRDHPIDHNIRVHTQAKIKWSSDLAGLKIRAGQDTISAIDEIRITHLLQRRADIDTHLGYMSVEEAKGHLEKFIEEKNLRMMSLFTICHGRTMVADVLKEQLIESKTPEASLAKDLADEIFSLMEDSQFLNAVDLKNIAEHVEKRLTQVMPPEPNGNPNPDCDSPKSDQEITNDIDDLLRQGMNEMLQKLMRREWKVELDYSIWGTLKVERPPLVTSIKPRMIHKKIRSSEDGIVLRDYSRMWSDGKIWSKIIRSKGGGVLIDCSGSMDLKKWQIEHIAKSAPAISVALYSGEGNNGVLREVIRNGRICEDALLKAPSGGMNVVDGPCLERWLALQTKPRVWVSDGWVNGVGGKTAQNLFDDAMGICRKYGIIRVNHIDTALQLFAKLERGGGMVHPALTHKQNCDIQRIK
jgi:hypothetical protein